MFMKNLLREGTPSFDVGGGSVRRDGSDGTFCAGALHEATAVGRCGGSFETEIIGLNQARLNYFSRGAGAFCMCLLTYEVYGYVRACRSFLPTGQDYLCLG